MKEKKNEIAAMILSAIFVYTGGFLFKDAEGNIRADAASPYVEISLSDAVCTEFAQFSLYQDTHRTRFLIQEDEIGWGILNLNIEQANWLEQITVNGKTVAEHKSEYEASGSPALETEDLYIRDYGCAPINVIFREETSISANVIDITIPESYLPAADMWEVSIVGPIVYECETDGTPTYILSDSITVSSEPTVTTEYTVTVDGIAQKVEAGGLAIPPETPRKAETATHYYEFLGWCYLNDKGEKVYWDFEKDVVNGDLVLTSDFREVEKTKCALTFDPKNGEAVTYIEVYYGGIIPSAQLPADPEKAETDEAKYAFVGWFNADMDTPFDVSAPITGSQTIEAKYLRTPKYSVTIDGETQRVLEGEKLSAPQPPTKAETDTHYYEFVGWYYLDGEGEKVYWDFENDVVNGDLVLTSEFRAVEKTKCALTFDPKNGEAVTYIEVYYGGIIPSAQLPADPEKAETDEAKYAFVGWFNADMDTPFDVSAPITGSQTIEAKYLRTPKYSVTIDGETQRVLEGEKLSAPQPPTKAETDTHYYEFVGWYYLDGEGEKVYWDFEKDVVNGDLTLEPDFCEVEKTKYTVVFDPANGEESTKIEVYEGSKIAAEALPADPEKADEETCVYLFAGWFNADVGTQFDFESTIEGDVSLIAKYTVIAKYIVKINGVEIRVLAGEKLSAPQPPTKEETESHTYQFLGWAYYREGEKIYWDFENDAVFSALTLEPDFLEVEKTKYTVTFDGDNGVAPTSVQVYEGALIHLAQIPGDPQKLQDGHVVYRFLCWSEDGLVAWDFSRDKVTRDTTLKACYTTKTAYVVSFDGETQTVEEGAYLTQPPTPEKPATAEYEYEFTGWYYLQGDQLCLWDFERDTVTDDVALLPQYTERKVCYVVYFYDEDGTNVAFTKKLAWGELIPYPTVEKKPWYRFLGWIDERGATAPTYMPTNDVRAYTNRELETYVATVQTDMEILGKKNYTLETAKTVLQDLRDFLLLCNNERYTYAWSSPLPDALEAEDCVFAVTTQKVSYKLKVVGDPERESETTKEYVLPWGEELVLSDPEPMRGRTFSGWKRADGESAPAYMPTNNLTLYAAWSWTEYTMTVLDGAGVEQVLTYTAKEGEDPSYVQALFARFLIPENLKAYTYGWAEPVPETLPLESGRVYTVVKTPLVYTLTFAGAEGIAPLSFTVETLTSLQLPEVPSKIGYTAKWDKTVSELGLEDATLTAIYTPVEYRITFLGVEGIEDIPFTVETLDEVCLPALPEREGYTARWDKKLSEIGLENTTVTAIYQPIVYTLTFAGAEGLEPVSFTVETLSQLTFPEVPERAGYTGAWNKLPSEITLADTTVTAVYTAIEYTLTFVGLEGAEPITFTVETIGEIEFPKIPKREGYTGAWDKTPADIPLADTTVFLVYTAIEYVVTFSGVEWECRIVFTIETLPYLTFPEVPARAGYTAVWDKTPSELGLENVRVEAIYTLLVYTVTFEADCEIEPVTFTVESKDAVVFPEVPERIGYVGTWSKTPSGLNLEDTTLTVVYTPVLYVISFVGVEGVDPIVFTIETIGQVRMPALPERKGYTGAWDRDLSALGLEDATVTALYTPIVYTLSFACEGIAPISYTVENKSGIELPAVPVKAGYEGRWDRDFATCDLEDVTLAPVYTAIVYTITFKGVAVEVLPIRFTVETIEELRFPEVPLKVGYSGVWDKTPSDVGLEDTIVTAVYTSLEEDGSSTEKPKFNLRGCLGTVSTGCIFFPTAIALWVLAKKKKD